MLIGQTPWAKAYDRFGEESYNDTAYSIACDTVDKAYVVVGHTNMGPLGGLDVLVTKLSIADGSVIWSRVFGPLYEGDDYGRSVIVDYDEDTTYYVVTGYTSPGIAPEDLADILIFKIKASDGSKVWGYRYCGFDQTGPLADYAYSITNDGGDYLVAGNVEGISRPAPCGGLSDALVMSVTADSGFPNWTRAYGKMLYDEFPTDDYLYSIIEDSSVATPNLWVVAGKSCYEVEPGYPMSDILAFKGKKSDGTIDPATRQLYDYSPPGRFSCAYNIKNDHLQPGYILTGDVDSSIVVMKLHPNLKVGWLGNCRIYTIPDIASSRCIENTSDGNYVFTGFTDPGKTSSFDLLMTKIDINGLIKWSKVLTGCPATPMNLDDYGQYVIEYPKDFYAATGYTDWPSPWTPANLLVAKTDANGDIPCPNSPNACLQDIDIFVDSPEVYVDSSVYEYLLGMEIMEIADSSVKVLDSLICGKFVGIEERFAINDLRLTISPNPLTYSTAISYQLPAKGNISLKIYDITGRKVKTLVSGEKEAGNYSVDFNAKELTTGIYFAKLVVGDFKATRKLTILR